VLYSEGGLGRHNQVQRLRRNWYLPVLQSRGADTKGTVGTFDWLIRREGAKARQQKEESETQFLPILKPTLIAITWVNNGRKFWQRSYSTPVTAIGNPSKR
jgi:hypothetical protein